MDTKGIKSKRLSTGAKEYEPKDLSQAKEDQSAYLTGDIIRNYTK